MVRRLLTTFFHSSDAAVALKLRVLYFEATGRSVNSVHDAYSVRAADYRLLCSLYKRALKEVIFDTKLSIKIDIDCNTLLQLKAELEAFDAHIAVCKKAPDWAQLSNNAGYPLYPE
jgi:hypothetical protein